MSESVNYLVIEIVNYRDAMNLTRSYSGVMLPQRSGSIRSTSGINNNNILLIYRVTSRDLTTFKISCHKSYRVPRSGGHIDA